ncbi:MAG: DUF892 family protein [Patescibacteria group bacterium]
MKYSSLEDIFILKLKSLYDIEHEIIKALPKMAKKASSPDLKAAFTEHCEQSIGQKERLEEAFEILGKKPQKTKVESIRGLVEDAKWLMDEDMTPEALDASLIGAAQYVEHLEMAGYGTARAWAEQLGYDDVAELLGETLTEEEETDQKLSQLAEDAMNVEAFMKSDKDEDIDEEKEAD